MSRQRQAVTGIGIARFERADEPASYAAGPHQNQRACAVSRRATAPALAPAVRLETNSRPVVRSCSPSPSWRAASGSAIDTALASSSRHAGFLPHFIRPHALAAGALSRSSRGPRISLPSLPNLFPSSTPLHVYTKRARHAPSHRSGSPEGASNGHPRADPVGRHPGRRRAHRRICHTHATRAPQHRGRPHRDLSQAGEFAAHWLLQAARRGQRHGARIARGAGRRCLDGECRQHGAGRRLAGAVSWHSLRRRRPRSRP